MLKPQGRLGEVAVQVLTDFPERFAERRRVFALDAGGARRELHLDNVWPHKQHLILKFQGIDSISQAEELVGCEVQIPRAERAVLDAGSVYISELAGCVVFDGERELGRVADVQFGAGEAPLLVIRNERKEYLVPLAQEYLRQMDTATRRIDMVLPEGMLELDAPLSEEEKRSQRAKSD